MKCVRLILMVIAHLPLMAQNTYLKTVGTSNSDYGTSCIPTSDMGAIITVGGGMPGGGIQFGLVKTNYDGSIQWEKLYMHNNFSLAQYVVHTPDGGLCVFGSVNKTASSNKALFIMKTDSVGNPLWTRKLEVTGNDRPAALIACESGGFLTCSVADYNLGGYPGALLVRYDNNGMVMWSKIYRGLQGIEPTSLVELPNGNFAFSALVNAAFTGPFKHTLVTCVDPQGDVKWSNMFYSDYDDQPFDMITNQAGELFISGVSYRIGNEWDGSLLKLDTLGDLVYSTFYDAGTSNGEYFRSLTVDDAGNFLILGDMGGFNERDVSLVNIHPSGELLWAKRYPLSPQFTNYGMDIFQATDGGIIFTGDVRPPTYVRDAVLFKTDKLGMISCYTEDANFNQYTTPFAQMQLFLSVEEPNPPSQESITFTYPLESITEKIICEDQSSIVQISSKSKSGCPHICVDFKDETMYNPMSWFWEFEGGNPATSTQQHPTNICFSEAGMHAVTLTISNTSGSATKQFSVNVGDFDCPITDIPNVFTPNGDGVNDVFYIPMLPTGSVLHILNRWGEVVFETTDKNQGWDGKTKQGIPVSDGVYFYRLETPKNDTYHGFVHLYR